MQVLCGRARRRRTMWILRRWGMGIRGSEGGKGGRGGGEASWVDGMGEEYLDVLSGRRGQSAGFGIERHVCALMIVGGRCRLKLQ